MFHREFTEANRELPAESALRSPLLALHHSSDVNPLAAEQIRGARAVLRHRQRLLDGDSRLDGGALTKLYGLQRSVVSRFLAGRRAYFGEAQVQPLPDVAEMAREGRDVFVVVKFMDEAPHIEATIRSLLNQRGVAPGRVVIVTVDNNSTDGSDEIVRSVASEYRDGVRVIHLRQPTPGAGNAARLGVDGAIATVYAMCEYDGRWDRLQAAVIGVSDGDTVYSPSVLRENLRLFDGHPDVDGVMPFLRYKLVASLRLFPGYRPARPAELRAAVPADGGVPTELDLSTVDALGDLPRSGRCRRGDTMELTQRDGGEIRVPLCYRDAGGEPFGALRDAAGRLAYVLADRRIVVAEAPVSGLDEPLVMLDNRAVEPRDKWRWHALVGHDMFLTWAFEGMGLPVEMVFPDTSDALKMFRVWSFAVGGQHQLRRTDLRIATGSDYQSGRVLQEVGAVVRLGPAWAAAETETDRLVKMVRNLVSRQGVFYGETRSPGLDRATGLYLHMTRIQENIEAEVRQYSDALFEHTVFPERVLFPLRWILQNAVRFAAHRDPAAARMVQDRLLRTVFPEDADEVERAWFGATTVDSLRRVEFHAVQDVAERIAEDLIAARYPALMRFYVRTLRAFMEHHRVDPAAYEWLLDGVPESRNAIAEPLPRVHPAVVWAGPQFEIDTDRGQVIGMNGPSLG